MNLETFISEISEPNENWANISGYEDLYMISTNGRVLAKEKFVNNGHKDVLKPCKILKNNSNNGRLSIQLKKEGTTKKFSISQLVAASFLPKPGDDYILKFKDKNLLNCKLDNLVWYKKIDRHAKYIIESIEGEIWKDIPGYEGYYAISNKGRIKSLSKDI